MSPFTDTHTAAATVYDLSLISLYTSYYVLKFSFCVVVVCLVSICVCKYVCTVWGAKLQAWPSVYPCLLT